jgi:hypothetical protein
MSKPTATTVADAKMPAKRGKSVKMANARYPAKKVLPIAAELVWI